jgi:hypothetical protein
MENPAQMSGLRRFVNRWMSRQLERRLGIACPDSQCGFRALRIAAWERVELRQDRYEIESEMMTAFARAGLRIKFVPVRCLKANRPSRIRPVADTVRWLRWWFASR